MKETIFLKDSDISLWNGFLNPEEADFYFNHLLKQINWQQRSIKIFGKEIPQPRLIAFFDQKNSPYSYSGLSMETTKFPPLLLEIKEKIENGTGEKFSSCLANFYRNGQDSIAWHSDNEKEMGKFPVIASLSLGATRTFQLKHKKNPDLKFSTELKSGSLLIMKGATQENYKHQIPKTKQEVGPRINFTFRNIGI